MRCLIFDDPWDGARQVLVTLWDSGAVEVATRPHEHASWGPPLTLARDETAPEAA